MLPPHPELLRGARSFPRAASPTAPPSQRGTEHRRVTGGQGRRKRSRAREGGGCRSRRPAPHPCSASLLRIPPGSARSAPGAAAAPQRDPRPQPGPARGSAASPAPATLPGLRCRRGLTWLRRAGRLWRRLGRLWQRLGPAAARAGFCRAGRALPAPAPPRHGADSPGRARLRLRTGWAREGQEQPLPPHPCPAGRAGGSRGCGDTGSSRGLQGLGLSPHSQPRFSTCPCPPALQLRSPSASGEGGPGRLPQPSPQRSCCSRCVFAARALGSSEQRGCDSAGALGAEHSSRAPGAQHRAPERPRPGKPGTP